MFRVASEDAAVAVEHVQTKREVAEALAAVGMRPRKMFGQNFLIDGNLMRQLVAAADLTKHDLAIEVGAGTGGLTDLLVARAGHVVSVEIDRDLQGVIAQRFQDHDNFRLISGDALETKHRIIDVLAAAIAGYDNPGGAVKLVANLPYQIATPLVMNLLVDYPQVRSFVFTVQAEVGDRVTASPGTKAYGPLAIISQLLTDASTVARIPPEAFWPRPSIRSVMLKLEVKPSPFGDVARLWRFASFVRGVFEHRRKTIRAAVRFLSDTDVSDTLFKPTDATRRPESFTLSEWLVLFERFESLTTGEP